MVSVVGSEHPTSPFQHCTISRESFYEGRGRGRGGCRDLDQPNPFCHKRRQKAPTQRKWRLVIVCWFESWEGAEIDFRSSHILNLFKSPTNDQGGERKKPPPASLPGPGSVLAGLVPEGHAGPRGHAALDRRGPGKRGI